MTTTTQYESRKKVEIDFMFIDLEVCTRCKGTDENLEQALQLVQSVLESAGAQVTVRKTLVDAEEKARELGFVSSPTIRANGRDIALEHRESSCASCGEVYGCERGVDCRVWFYQGEEHTVAPAPMIVDAILAAVYGTKEDMPMPSRLEPVPENLKRFFCRKGGEGELFVLQPGRASVVLRAGSEVDLLRSSGGSRPTGWLWLSMNRTASTPDTEAIWREFHERLRAFVSRRVPRPADVDDILQEVFIRIQRAAGSLQNRERLLAWTFQITRNAIVDHFRAYKRQADAPRDDLDWPAHDAGDGGSEQLELSACIEPMIAALPERYREAIELTDLKGLTQIKAAQRSGLSFSGMKSRVQRARRQLKNMLLDCCRIELDRRGGIVDYSVRDVSRSPCGTCGRED